MFSMGVLGRVYPWSTSLTAPAMSPAGPAAMTSVGAETPAPTPVSFLSSPLCSLPLCWPCGPHHQLGASILEAVLALTLSSAVATTATLGLGFQLRVLARLSRQQRAISSSRGILEWARTFPCNAPETFMNCPSEFTCTLDRESFTDPQAASTTARDRRGLERVQVTIADRSRNPLLKMTTLVKVADLGHGCSG